MLKWGEGYHVNEAERDTKIDESRWVRRPFVKDRVWAILSAWLHGTHHRRYQEAERRQAAQPGRISPSVQEPGCARLEMIVCVEADGKTGASNASRISDGVR